MKNKILLLAGFTFLCNAGKSQTVTDIDNNVYQTVQIGTQIWMAENLKVTHYNNGDTIPYTVGNSDWNNLTTGAFSVYNNDINNKNTYGLLYNWYVTNDIRKIAPKGWHVPSDKEWYVLEKYLGDSLVAGGAMKEAGTAHWNIPNAGASNSSGFDALPGGYRDYHGYYNHLGAFNNFWSTTEIPNSETVWHRGMGYDDERMLRYVRYKKFGFSIRCIKNNVDESTGLKEINNGYRLNLYPNPANDIVYINSVANTTSGISIFNLLSELVMQQELAPGMNKIDISALPKGIYVIKHTDVNIITTQQKLVKE